MYVCVCAHEIIVRRLIKSFAQNKKIKSLSGPEDLSSNECLASSDQSQANKRENAKDEKLKGKYERKQK